MRMKLKLFRLFLLVITMLAGQVAKAACNKAINPESDQVGKYIFVSFSMNDSSLRRYYAEANKLGAKLIIRGFVKDASEKNVFISTKKRVSKAKINVDINPGLFERCKIEAVPSFAVIEENGDIYKASGHISFDKALEIIEQYKREAIGEDEMSKASAKDPKKRGDQN